MRPLSKWDRLDAARTRVVFTDIDDTLTTDGLLEAPAFSALWQLHEAQISVVPVTGRPAGWCDHFARMWPVAGVVGENGGLCYRYDRATRRMDRFYAQSPEERTHARERLEEVAHAVLLRVPRARVAADQPFRELDLAIDFAEDVGPLSKNEIDEIVAVFESFGATAKVSSIHVNGWFGSYDKLSMIRTFAHRALALDLASDQTGAVYVGDSPNDEPAFAAFERSVGVANVADFTDRFHTLPAFVTKSRGGAGFAELATFLLEAR
ncbi:MAG: HAD-IIB family hydrolase [Deltaproteobacteria bacterium]|nr:HAD-IIB family hydrolase [Deltaproteobacteria bacterium]